MVLDSGNNKRKQYKRKVMSASSILYNVMSIVSSENNVYVIDARCIADLIKSRYAWYCAVGVLCGTCRRYEVACG